MPSDRGWPAFRRSVRAGRVALVTVLATGFVFGARPAARAQDTAVATTISRYTVSNADGPSSLLQGSDGNLYGVTAFGGSDAYNSDSLNKGYGTVFQLTPAGVRKTVYTFTGSDDGARPYRLIQGGDGNFYGVTTHGGPNYDNSGTVFRLTPGGVLTTLHAFTDYATPAQLVAGADGDLYGTTLNGGTNNDDGTVFRLTPAGVYTVLHGFTGGSDGAGPGALVMGGDGNLYGTTGAGDGTIFQLTPSGAYTLLHGFAGTDGSGPDSLVQAGDGDFYGATSGGGAHGAGTLFRITPAGALTTLYSFSGAGDIGGPVGLVAGGDGNFYGRTHGNRSFLSSLFQLTPAGRFTILYLSMRYLINEITPAANGDLYAVLYDYSAFNGFQVDESVVDLTIVPHPAFFTGQEPLDNGVNYLAFANGNPFGYYAFLGDPAYLYHFDLGYEYLFDADDGSQGIYLYDFASSDFFYTSPAFPFPYLYDFALNSVVYYYPVPNSAGRYTSGPRFFYDFSQGRVIAK